jgi:hypothetical protein
MRTSHFKWFAILVFAMMTACSAAEKTSFGDSGSSDESSETPSSEGSPLYVYLQTKPEGSTNGSYTTFDSCIIASTVSAGTTDAVKDCTFTVPELKLYYSDLKFVVGTNASTTCTHVQFRPYHFLRSLDPAFRETAAGISVDCSEGNQLVDSDCWGGAAVGFMGSSFPANGALYFLPENTLQSTYESISANRLRGTHGSDPHYLTNRVFANNLVDTATTLSSYAGYGTHYVGNSMAGYRVACNDEYSYARYEINLEITDDDGEDVTDDGLIDDITDWQ